MINRLCVTINGSSFYISTSEPEEYIKSLEQQLNQRVDELLGKHSSMSFNTGLVLICLNLLDAAAKNTDSADNMRSQLSEYIEDAAKVRLQLEEARREIDRLRQEIKILENS